MPPRRTFSLLGSAIAADAKRYDGAGYVYGGNASSRGNWDCSSFVSYVLGHDLRLALPGGRWGQPGFPPSTHGPVVMSYALWAGAYDVPVPQAGDLCVWAGDGPAGHIGIALDSTRMISALNSSLGTLVTPIVGTGPSTAPLSYRRLSGVIATGAPVGVGVQPQAPNITQVIAVAALLGLGALAVSVLAGLVIPIGIAIIRQA